MEIKGKYCPLAEMLHDSKKLLLENVLLFTLTQVNIQIITFTFTFSDTLPKKRTLCQPIPDILRV